MLPMLASGPDDDLAALLPAQPRRFEVSISCDDSSWDRRTNIGHAARLKELASTRSKLVMKGDASEFVGLQPQRARVPCQDR